MKTKVAIIYYSSTGTNYETAKQVAAGVEQAGGEVRMRLVEETAPEEAIESKEEWKAFVEAHKNEPRASHDDMLWADAVVFGTPTRFGNMASQLKGFLDSLGPLWFEGKLANKVYSGFTSAQNPHGGLETTLSSLYNTICHFGGIIVPPGYTDQSIFEAGGNPYGSATATGGEPGSISEADQKAARFQGKRVCEIATMLKKGKS